MRHTCELALLGDIYPHHNDGITCSDKPVREYLDFKMLGLVDSWSPRSYKLLSQR